uniref:Putative secreted protein n=1 Tax=Ixodes ricinus TaxID=34613 RepID=A0A6B0UCG7_IXORI
MAAASSRGEGCGLLRLCFLLSSLAFLLANAAISLAAKRSRDTRDSLPCPLLLENAGDHDCHREFLEGRGRKGSRCWPRVRGRAAAKSLIGLFWKEKAFRSE